MKKDHSLATLWFGVVFALCVASAAQADEAPRFVPLLNCSQVGGSGLTVKILWSDQAPDLSTGYQAVFSQLDRDGNSVEIEQINAVQMTENGQSLEFKGADRTASFALTTDRRNVAPFAVSEAGLVFDRAYSGPIFFKADTRGEHIEDHVVCKSQLTE